MRMTAAATPAMSPEMQALKTRLRATWMAGDYAEFDRYMEEGARAFLERLGLAPGTRLLDVACGAGRLAVPAAQAGAIVTGLDLAANLVAQGRARARAAGVTLTLDEGDAEALPYPDGSFDVVVSLIGAMFAPRPELVAAELIRVCRPGGRIVMGNWTPDGFVGEMFRVMARHVPPSPLMPAPTLWGDEATARTRLGAGGAIRTTRRTFPFRYPFPPAEVVEFFRRWYGPTNRAFASLDDTAGAALRRDLEALWAPHWRAEAGPTEVLAEYLEVEVLRNR
jgi:SAM-dependent methyltransferase